MDHDVSFFFRLVNIGLASFVIVLCVLKLLWNQSDKARYLRIISLGILTVVVAWTAYELRYESFHIRIPLTTVGLLLAAIGLNTMSTEPERFKPRKRYSKP